MENNCQPEGSKFGVLVLILAIGVIVGVLLMELFGDSISGLLNSF